VGCRPPPVEQPRLGEEGDAGADTGKERAAPVALHKPRQELRVAPHPLVRHRARSRYEDEVGPLDLVDGRVGGEAQAVGAPDRLAVDGGHGDAESLLRRPAVHRVPHRARGSKDLDRSHRGGSVAVVHEHDRNVGHSRARSFPSAAHERTIPQAAPLSHARAGKMSASSPFGVRIVALPETGAAAMFRTAA
jgi:hypothetical protein